MEIRCPFWISLSRLGGDNILNFVELFDKIGNLPRNKLVRALKNNANDSSQKTDIYIYHFQEVAQSKHE